jgi:dTDP-4-amino-4,6-dideoxygalactose transaminase
MRMLARDGNGYSRALAVTVTGVPGGRRSAAAEALDSQERPWVVPLSDVAVDEEIERAVMEAVRSGWWSMGPRVAAFEEEFASFCGAKRAFAVANGTAALHLALLAVGCSPGDEVLVPSLNVVAAANTIGHAGAVPVFCDIEGPSSLNVDPNDIGAAIGPATRAIMVMHYGGHPCRMDAVADLAARHGLAVIEDAAHAPGATWRGRRCGTLGDVGCFSFFSNKNLPTGEGGMVVTDDDELAERIRLLRSHGMTTLTWDRHRGHAHTYDVLAQGFNYRLDELRAAIGLVQLRRLVKDNQARADIVTRYRAELDGEGGIEMPFTPEAEAGPAHHLAVILLPPSTSRDEFRTSLAARGIQTSVHYPPIHQFSCYRALGGRRPLPATDAVASRLVTLPLYPHMDDSDVAAVTAAVLSAI